MKRRFAAGPTVASLTKPIAIARHQKFLPDRMCLRCTKSSSKLKSRSRLVIARPTEKNDDHELAICRVVDSSLRVSAKRRRRGAAQSIANYLRQSERAGNRALCRQRPWFFCQARLGRAGGAREQRRCGVVRSSKRRSAILH